MVAGGDGIRVADWAARIPDVRWQRQGVLHTHSCAPCTVSAISQLAFSCTAVTVSFTNEIKLCWIRVKESVLVHGFELSFRSSSTAEGAG